ncbi:MAG: hypothetical protein NDI69_01915 [Bacteriovoracaceae bacterium]|nr:hypothetical protein [Bacteriovoracaceae bacterium]
MPRRSVQKTSISKPVRSNRRKILSSEAVIARSGSYRNVLRNLSKNSTTKYVLGGIVGILLVRYAVKYYQEHPEISDFFRENFDTIEGRLRQYRHDLTADTSTMSRH